MKKFGILTFHNAHNFGAMLQAYALATFINDLDINCVAEIINYKLPAVERYSHRDSFLELVIKEGPIGIVRWGYRKFITGYYSNLAWKRFLRFQNKELPLSREIKRADLENLTYDGYIVGSDQIWNGDLTDGIQKCYFLDFAKPNTMKIAYAASTGRDSLDIEDSAILDLLRKFNFIGIREDSLRVFLKKECGLDCQTVIDPVFLLDVNTWSKFIKKPCYENYLLIYVFDESLEVYDYARSIAEKYNLKIIALACHGIKELGDDILQIDTAGPEEFLSYVYYADYIVTSSFHCTAFSVIFNKQFVCFPHPKYHERTDYILKLCGIENRSIVNKTDRILEEIEYDDVNSKLFEEIERSRFFLKRAISDNGVLFSNYPYDKKDNCCGCTACARSCPVNAIVMKPDSEGFLYPVIEGGKCIGCNNCLNVCTFKKKQFSQYKNA